MKKNYSNDKRFLEKNIKVIELSDGDRKVLLTPDYQGRVLTSTAGNDDSYGWLNYDLIASGKHLPHCNNFGGEDRFWLGPEGGQYSIFFPAGSDFAFDDWQTPAVIDTEAWSLLDAAPKKACFEKKTTLRNYAGHDLVCGLEREVTLLDDNQIEKELGTALPDNLSAVAFRSENRLTNRGDFDWNRTTGMLSIWVLGQFVVSEANTIMIPFHPAAGEQINDAYFGKIGDDRLQVVDNVIYFKGDGRKRGKIGIPPGMTIPACGAYDQENGVLTLVKLSFDPARKTYVNSMWEHQAEPFRGDVINAYNDGPLDDGSIMGPFYEIESSSPAARLAPGESVSHIHTTLHLSGDQEVLNNIARKVLEVDLKKMSI